MRLNRLTISTELLNAMVHGITPMNKKRNVSGKGYLLNTMSKIILIAFIISVFVLSAHHVTAANQAVFYVSTTGNDANVGTIDQPFATIDRARQVISTINANMTGNIVVYIRGGNYTATQTINLGNTDSGTNGFYVIYTNYPEEKPVISCGTKVSGWTLDTGLIYKANVGIGIDFRQLYVNGRREVRARTPNTGYRTISTKQTDGFNIDLGLLNGVSNLANIEMAVNILWMHKRLRISSKYDVTGFTRAVINPIEWSDIKTQPQGSTDYTARQFWLENAKEFIDVEGEWYYNKLTGYLYYWPRSAENISTAEIIIPKVQTLFNLSGTFNAPVHHIEISGLEIRHTNWSRPNDYGFVDVQANSLIPSPPNDNTDSQYRHNQKKDRVPAAINTYSASDIRVLRNRFFNLGGTGVTFDAGGKNNDAIGNTFCDLSGGAIEVGNDARNPLDSRMRPAKDSICNNYITYIGQEYYGACAITVYYADSTVISHNEIKHMSYGGISIGWGWSDGTAPTPRKPNFNTINHNRIDFASEKLFDTGGIYTDNAADNSEIAWNYITNTVLDVGIFNDEMTHDFNIHDNVLEGNHSYNVNDEGWIRINGIQSNNIYTNNSDKGYTPANRTAIIANAGLEEPYKSLIYSNLPALVPTPAPLPSDGGVIDNFDQGYIEYGTWYNSIKPGYNNSLTRYSELVGAAVIWNPSLNAGTYKVSIYRISSGDPNTKIDVVHKGVTSTFSIDYSLPDGWVELGTFEFAAGIDGYVKLTQMTNATNGRADAVKFEKYTATNVVLGKTVTVSGTTYSGAPSYLTDGILLDETNTSRWRGDIPSTVDFDLGAAQTIAAADVYTGYWNGIMGKSGNCF